MKNVSKQYLEKMQSNLRTFVPRMTIDGVEISGEIQAGLSVAMGSCGTEQFAIGACFIPTMTATITECSTPLQDKEILLEMGLVLDDGTVEYKKVGYFTVERPDKDKFQTSFTAYGRLMSKAGSIYISNLTFPATIASVLDDIEKQTGLNIVLNGLTAEGTINTPIVGELCREVLVRIAGLLGGFVTEDGDGNIVLSKYSLNKAATVDTDFCYSYPETNENPYTVTGIEVVISEGGTDDEGNEIEGVKYSSETEVNVIIQNPYMTESLFKTCEANIVGFSYMPAKVEFLGDIRLEPWDSIVLTDEDPAAGIDIPCMNITHVWDGGLVTTITAPGKTSTETSSAFGGPLSKLVERTYQQLLLAEQVIAKKVTAEYVDANYASIEKLDATNAYIKDLEAKSITTENLSAKVADLGYATVERLNATDAKIDLLDAKTIKADELESKVGGFGYLKAGELSAAVAKLGYATVTSLNAVDAKFGTLSSTYATLDLANVKAGSITSAMIGTGVVGTAQIADGSITDAKIVGLTASKITAGTLDAGTIDVINLNAANITVGTINGQQIASGAIDLSKLSSGLNQTISNADSNAQNALDVAVNAQATADGKNTAFYQASAPSTSGRKVNDLWFDTDDGNKMYYWNGSAWTASTFGNSAIANLDAGKITTGYLDAGRIAADTITGSHIASGTITADNIKAATITSSLIGADQITATHLAAGSVTAEQIVAGAITGSHIASKTISANNIVSGTITATEIAAGTITAAKIAANTITADKLSVASLSAITANLGTITAGALQSVDYRESDFSISDNGEVSGSVISGVKLDLNEKGYYTPHIVIKDDFVIINGYQTIGTRATPSTSVDHYIGPYSLVVGKDDIAYGSFSIVSGMRNREVPISLYSAPMLANVVEGMDNLITNGAETGVKASHVGGIGNECRGASAQTIIGKYNAIDITASYEDPYGTYAFIVGNGTSSTNRSNAFTLDWSGNANFAGTIKQNGTAVSLSGHTHSYLPLNGGQMTGQLKTSYNSSVAVGSCQPVSTTMEAIVAELRYSSGCMGSFILTAAYTKNNITIAANIWYNYIYIPHRSGGVNGQASGDNCNYGTLLVFGMTADGQQFRIRVGAGAIAELARIDTNTTYRLSSFGLSATATELNYCDGVTSNIQTQLNNKMASDRIVLGTYVYNGSSTSDITISGANSSGKSFVIACCQDAGAAVAMAKIYRTNVLVHLTSAVTLARINYILFN